TSPPRRAFSKRSKTISCKIGALMAEKEDVSRREFVKKAGAAAAIAAPAIQTIKAANDQVQYGFIGTGSRGQYLIQHINQTDRGRCVATCDLFETNLKKGADL